MHSSKTMNRTTRKVDEKENNICCLCLCAAGQRDHVHPMLRMIFKLYWMPICDTCEHALYVKQRYFIAWYRRRWLRRNGRMKSYNFWKIDVDGYLWGHSWPENFYRYNPRDSTMELAVRFWRKTGQIIWDYEKLN